KRFDMCRSKGFDAVEPDLMEGYGNDTGFPPTPGPALPPGLRRAARTTARPPAARPRRDADGRPNRALDRCPGGLRPFHTSPPPAFPRRPVPDGASVQ
ncbi:endo alpha-1,4 polygalactosaminidase, partial [Streptomyces goshikiensis]|uniref:endo alpha-1,4 polygalactosaminidase n=1 Tax=Streptomyces goshikiensis TaxID=1942 RepID=UPI00340BCFC7